MSVNKLTKLTSQGFTVVELAVVTTIMAVVGVVFLGIAGNYMATISRNNQLSEMTVSSQNLLRATVEHLRFGDGVRQTNQITDSNAPAGGWNTTNTIFVIIIAVPALNSSNNYIIDPDTGNPYMNELVYYKNGSTLKQRKLANPLATGNKLRTTCPTAITGCSADPVLAQYVETMIFTLYDQNAVQTNDPALARSVKINLNMRRPGAGNPVNLSTDIRATLRNRF